MIHIKCTTGNNPGLCKMISVPSMLWFKYISKTEGGTSFMAGPLSLKDAYWKGDCCRVCDVNVVTAVTKDGNGDIYSDQIQPNLTEPEESEFTVMIDVECGESGIVHSDICGQCKTCHAIEEINQRTMRHK
jgi:hypothetical protein